MFPVSLSYLLPSHEELEKKSNNGHSIFLHLYTCILLPLLLFDLYDLRYLCGA